MVRNGQNKAQTKLRPDWHGDLNLCMCNREVWKILDIGIGSKEPIDGPYYTKNK